MLNVKKLLSELTLEEKASLCSGKDFWTTKAIERVGIPSWMMTDGPHGLRKQKSGDDASVSGSLPATCFPSGVGLASTWNPALIEEVGQALGREAKAAQVGVVLGPAVNIKRSPLCGRNFEYLSEDPYLTGVMAKHHIKGVQSQGIGASIKHFAANNQERLRMTIDAIVDERAFREIYLTGFEIAIRGAQPWTVMCSYNKINGTYASENRHLLTEILKEEWGHTGLVVTDWGAANDRVAGLKAGQELEMPGNGGLTDTDIVRAVREGALAVAELDKAVERILALTMQVMQNTDSNATFDTAAHHKLARKAASESIVLLKNDTGILPLPADRKVAIIGAFARSPRFQGAGSSHITPTQLDDALAQIQSLAKDARLIHYAPGYELKGETPHQGLIEEACQIATSCEAAVLFLGLTDAFESEGFDRSHLRIPASHTSLLDAVLKVQPRCVVVLSNGSPVEMPWIDRVPSIVESYLGGQAWGSAVADVLMGVVNPSGKLAETFPIRIQDTPSYLNFPGDGRTVEYKEGLFVGYRHFDAVEREPLFAFGHGLSYTRFDLGPLTLSKTKISEGQTVEVSLTVSNVGTRAGSEVVQLYVGLPDSKQIRPVRELKGFEKVELAAGERRVVTFTLDSRSFATWFVPEHRWYVETGIYELSAGTSSRDLKSTATLEVKSSNPPKVTYDQNTVLGDLADHPVGGIFVKMVMKQFEAAFGSYEPGSAEALMMENMTKEMPLRNLVRMSGGRFPAVLLKVLLSVLNGLEPFSALEKFIPK